MKLDAAHSCITFRCDHKFFLAVVDGKKTAEVRILSRDEWEETERAQPRWLRLVDNAADDYAITKRIGYMAEVGQPVVGSHLVLFCFAPSRLTA